MQKQMAKVQNIKHATFGTVKLVCADILSSPIPSIHMAVYHFITLETLGPYSVLYSLLWPTLGLTLVFILAVGSFIPSQQQFTIQYELYYPPSCPIFFRYPCPSMKQFLTQYCILPSQIEMCQCYRYCRS